MSCAGIKVEHNHPNRMRRKILYSKSVIIMGWSETNLTEKLNSLELTPLRHVRPLWAGMAGVAKCKETGIKIAPPTTRKGRVSMKSMKLHTEEVWQKDYVSH